MAGTEEDLATHDSRDQGAGTAAECILRGAPSNSTGAAQAHVRVVEWGKSTKLHAKLLNRHQ